ncbi:MAG: hypothetical protein RL308_3109 [Bacteroidota bacterium]|jgi:hypothetical protein
MDTEKELVMKLFQKQIEITGNGDGNLCVEMALIAVNEILGYMGADRGTEFWLEVKSELKKL